MSTSTPPENAAIQPMNLEPRSSTSSSYSRTRLNAFRHGLTAREFVFSPEEAPKYVEHSMAVHFHYQPEGLAETHLVDLIANAMWRLDRAAAIEEGIFLLNLESAQPADADEAALAPARAWIASDRKLSLLTTYEARIRRSLASDKAELAKLQDARKAQQPANPTASEPQAAEPKPATPKSVCSTQPAAPDSPAAPLLLTSKNGPQYVVIVDDRAKNGRRDAA